MKWGNLLSLNSPNLPKLSNCLKKQLFCLYNHCSIIETKKCATISYNSVIVGCSSHRGPSRDSINGVCSRCAEQITIQRGNWQTDRWPWICLSATEKNGASFEQRHIDPCARCLHSRSPPQDSSVGSVLMFTRSPHPHSSFLLSPPPYKYIIYFLLETHPLGLNIHEAVKLLSGSHITCPSICLTLGG